MKRIFIGLVLLLSIIFGFHVSAQVINLSTGIDNTTSALIPILSNDDTWQIRVPGSSVYQPVRCGTGIPDGSPTAYTGKNPNVRWLSPNLNAAGDHTNASPEGNYLFRTTFRMQCAGPQTLAVLTFSHIGGDNKINAIIVNGTSYTVNYGFGPTWGTGSFNIGANLINGTNEIIVRLVNEGSFTGMELEGNVTITSMTPPDPSFCISATGTTVKATPNTAGTHTWEVFTSTTGDITGQYTPLFTTTSNNIEITDEGPCYYIKHTVTTECGTSCAAQMSCKTSCDFNSCGMTPPTDLSLNGSTFSWNAVPGAVSYDLVIITNDPRCCSTKLFGAAYLYNTTGTSFTVNFAELGDLACFSWLVRAFCADGSSVESAQNCVTVSGGNNMQQSLGSVNMEAGISLNLYPNPTHGTVTFDVKTASDQELTIEIFDIKGKLVKRLDPEKTRNKKAVIRWDAESLAKGTYLVKVLGSDKQTATSKLVIE